MLGEAGLSPPRERSPRDVSDDAWARWLAAGRPGGRAAATARMAAIKRIRRARTNFDAGCVHGDPVAPCADRPT
jgi:hypothetical protein